MTEAADRARGMPALAWRVVTVAGRRVAFQVAGAGAPVILVHGLAGSTRWWAPVLPALARRHRVYLVDLPGFGAQGRGRRFALAQAASWLLAWQAAAGVGPAHLVGHSLGGYVCLRVAAARPAAVRRLVLLAPAGMPPGRGLIAHLGPVARERGCQGIDSTGGVERGRIV